MAEPKYILRVTAGHSYSTDSHVDVPVNKPDLVSISSDFMDIDLNVRIQGYRGLPFNSPETSPYFSCEPHATSDDRYSICFRFTPKAPPAKAGPSDAISDGGTNTVATAPTEGPGEAVSEVGNPPSSVEVTEEGASHPQSSSRTSSRPSPSQGSPSRSRSQSQQSRSPSNSSGGSSSASLSSTPAEAAAPVRPAAPGISALDLQFGNDFDRPIRDKLPPGFNTALNWVKWWIDPGLDGDAYSDTPHLYGPALSSVNTVHIGAGTHDPECGGLWFEEGGDEEGMEWRTQIGVPEGYRERMKWALRQESKEAWVWEYGRTYGIDFFNPYLDFAEFGLRLPVLTLPILKYLNTGKKPKRSHTMRYVLRNKSTGDTYLVVVFTLHLVEYVNEDGTLKPDAFDVDPDELGVAKSDDDDLAYDMEGVSLEESVDNPDQPAATSGGGWGLSSWWYGTGSG